ncbi:MAG: ATP-binding protein [Caldilineaceae bacterium]
MSSRPSSSSAPVRRAGDPGCAPPPGGRGQWTHVEFLSRLLEDEVERRAQKQLALRVRRATVNTAKTLENYDFSFNPSVKRSQILQLASGDYIRQKRNVLVCGPTGVGKSHLAQALAHEAIRQGYDVLFVNAHKMLQHLYGGRADGSLEKRLQVYLRPDLLILDDFGLKPLQAPGPEDLYDVINERYEKGSIMLTSNPCPRRVARPLWQPAARLGRARPPGAPCRDGRHHRPELPGPEPPAFGATGAVGTGGAQRLAAAGTQR